MVEDGPAENVATFPTVFTSRKEEKAETGVTAQTVDNIFEEKTHTVAYLFYYFPSSSKPSASNRGLKRQSYLIKKRGFGILSQNPQILYLPIRPKLSRHKKVLTHIKAFTNAEVAQGERK